MFNLGRKSGIISLSIGVIVVVMVFFSCSGSVFDVWYEEKWRSKGMLVMWFIVIFKIFVLKVFFYGFFVYWV